MTYDWIAFVADLADVVPGGMYSLGGALLVIGLIVGLLLQPAGLFRLKLGGPWKRTRKPVAVADVVTPPTVETEDDTLDDTPADQMVERALGYMARGEYRLAIREWLRVQVRELVDRGVILNRPGMTVTELARDGSTALPGLTAVLGEAALLFSDVWYGGHDATAVAATRMRDLTDRLRTGLPHAQAPIVITVEAQ